MFRKLYRKQKNILGNNSVHSRRTKYSDEYLIPVYSLKSEVLRYKYKNYVTQMLNILQHFTI